MAFYPFKFESPIQTLPYPSTLNRYFKFKLAVVSSAIYADRIKFKYQRFSPSGYKKYEIETKNYERMSIVTESNCLIPVS